MQNDLTIWAIGLLLVAARLAGMMFAAPVFGQAAVPVRLKVLIALALSLALAGRAGKVTMPAGEVQLLMSLSLEFGIGAAVGYAASLVFAGVELGAAQVSAQMGLSLGDVFSGAGDEPSGPVGTLMRMVTIAVFLAIGGHRDLVSGVMDTFAAAPVASLAPTGAMVKAAAGLAAASFVLALKVAAPVLVAMLVATVALGLLQKTVPQCHILSTGLPVRAMLGMLVLALSMAALAWTVEAAWNLLRGGAGRLFAA